jgi:hypothetical protein
MPEVLRWSGPAIRIVALTSNLLEELDGGGNGYRWGINHWGINCMT